MPRGRGGYREPSSPAAVSGPGALSKRTDGPVKQPKPATQTSASGQSYGQRVAQDRLRSSAPITPGSPQGSTSPGSQVGSSGPGNSQPPIVGGIRDKLFAPTDRPNEPLTAGANAGAGANGPDLLPQDPDELLRAAYTVYPDPVLLHFMRDMHL